MTCIYVDNNAVGKEEKPDYKRRKIEEARPKTPPSNPLPPKGMPVIQDMYTCVVIRYLCICDSTCTAAVLTLILWFLCGHHFLPSCTVLVKASCVKVHVDKQRKVCEPSFILLYQVPVDIRHLSHHMLVGNNITLTSRQVWSSSHIPNRVLHIYW